MPHPDAYRKPRYRTVARLSETPAGTLARYVVVDETGTQAYPKPGSYETMMSCDLFVERKTRENRTREVR